MLTVGGMVSVVSLRRGVLLCGGSDSHHDQTQGAPRPARGFKMQWVASNGYRKTPRSPIEVSQPDTTSRQDRFSVGLSFLQLNLSLFFLPLFLFYFVGGYFIYASLFAAVGSAMGDDMGESQPLTFVAMAPIIIAIILITPVIENPTSPLATWASIFPLTSPVLMPGRLAFEPPLWEVLLSMVVLAGSSVFFVWLSGRIYRVGILMYGKKVTIKELGKWMFYRD